MRYCHICKEPMYTSNHSMWINKKNYDVHSKCKNAAISIFGLKKKVKT